MKNISKTFAILFLFLSYGCKAQQMVLTPNEAYKLKENEQLYINKPLKNLLKEIKPEIKTAFGTLDNPSYFSFRFIDAEEFRNGRAVGKNHLGLYVYVKEPIEEWSNGKRPKEIEFQWTKEDLKTYGNFTVVRIKVIGKD